MENVALGVDRKRKLMELGSVVVHDKMLLKSNNPGTYLQLRTVCCERAEARRDNDLLLK
jgi:hypothetical protein